MKYLKELCDEIIMAVMAASDFIVRESASFGTKDIEVKGLNNFVTYVDKGSEQILVEQLKTILPEAGFITEEGTAEKKGRKYDWIIDPLDGTTNFLHRVNPYAVSIGLREDEEIIAGVIHDVVGRETFTAWKGGGAWLNGQKIQVSETPELKGSLVATGFPYSRFDRLNPYMDLITYLVKRTHGIRRLGSAAIDLAYVACGRFDIFFEYDLKIWDIAAGIIIVREAGGKFSDFSGGSTNLTGDETIATNPLIYDEFLEIVQKFMSQGEK